METTLDDLLHGELKIHQPLIDYGPRVNIDTILLAHYVRMKARDRVLELGCAHGAVSLILARRRSLERQDDRGTIEGMDIQEDLLALATRNAALNNLQRLVAFKTGDLRKSRDLFPPQVYDVIVMNPPYDEIGKSQRHLSSAMATALHGEQCALCDVIAAAGYLLKNKGRLFLVMRAKRLGELFSLMDQYNVRPKRFRTVHPKQGCAASVVLVEGVRASGDGVIVESPLFVQGEDGAYTADLEAAYLLEKRGDASCR